MVVAAMRIYTERLIGPRVYECACCSTPLALRSAVISKARSRTRTHRRGDRRGMRESGPYSCAVARSRTRIAVWPPTPVLWRRDPRAACARRRPPSSAVQQFQGRCGKAFLFDTASNVYLGPKEERMLLTGMHVVADLFCVVCHNNVGWQYLAASEPSQAYKVRCTCGETAASPYILRLEA